jgi:hypothetical protein
MRRQCRRIALWDGGIVLGKTRVSMFFTRSVIAHVRQSVSRRRGLYSGQQ